MRVPAATLLLVWFCAANVPALEVPAQFSVWGARGPSLQSAPAGWTEIPAELLRHERPEPTAAETKRGFLLFQRPPFTPIYPDTVPAPFERCDRIKTFAAQGQYQPASFAMFAFVPLKDIRVTVAELKSKRGDWIPDSCIDIRVVKPVRSPASYGDAKDKRFSWSPFYLEKQDVFDAPQGKTVQVWLTIKIPDDAKPGDYYGAIQIEVKGKLAQQAELVAKVLPFRLPAVHLETALSYYPVDDPALLEKEMIDHREHGIVANESAIGARVESRDKHFGEDDAEVTRKSIRAVLTARKKVYGPAANQFPITVEVGHQVLYEWDSEKGWFRFWPRSPALEQDFFRAIAVCQETIQQEQGPKMRLFIMDEPGGHPDSLQETLYYNQLIKERLPGLETYATLGGGLGLGIDELGLLGPMVDLITVNRFDAGICRTLSSRGKPYGIYNGGGATEAVTGYTRDRFFFGFYGWKTGASEILQWVYRFGDPWKTPFRGNHGYVMPASDGPLPSIPWEGIRAGIDDYRYMDLLWRLITAARQDPSKLAAAKAGEDAALDVLANIGFSHQPRTGDGTAAPSCPTLEHWRWQIASACETLLRVVPLEQALRIKPRRPTPLELPEPAAKRPDVNYGAESLPNTGFENESAPWKHTGPSGSKGAREEVVAHSGKFCFLLENAATATGMDVSVCVWGWGGQGPTMELQAGHSYEFSAYVRTGSGTSAKPQVRLALPDGALLLEESGEDSAEASGWQRLWRRVTLSKTSKPNYLAIWLQGPGKVWADDLSLREVHRPPFLVATDPMVLDGSVRSVTVRLKQFSPAEIAVTLHAPDRNGPRTVVVPAQGEALFDFDVSELKFGTSELKAELSSPTSPPFSQTLTFKKVPGPFD